MSPLSVSYLLPFIIATLDQVAAAPHTEHESNLRRKLTKSSKGKGDSVDIDYTLPPFEAVLQHSGSNDSTHLEQICGLFVDFARVAASSINPMEECGNFDNFNNLLCPDDYEVQKICSSSGSSDILDASFNAYCLPLFQSMTMNSFSKDGMICAEICNLFIVQADCCKLRCP